jgi:putative Ca2+/H+ antiporter (TMEM165/GDT1 family)
VAIQVGGGILFVLFGVWTYFRYEPEEPIVIRDSKGAFLTVFTMNALAELGGKTQLAVIILAASTAAPWSVFAGASLALAGVAGASVAIGTVLARVLRAGGRPLASTILFFAAGALLIIEALLPG